MGVIGAIAFFLAVDGLSAYIRSKRAVAGAETAELMRLRIDLSQPGEYYGDLHQTASFTCKQVLRVETPRSFASSDDAAAALEGLSGHLVIKNANGHVVYKTEVTPEAFWVEPTGSDCSPGFLIAPGRNGEYQVVLSVQQGAPALKDVPQELVGRYLLCGIEYMRTTFIAILALVFAVICAAMVWIIIAVTKKKTFQPAHAADE